MQQEHHYREQRKRMKQTKDKTSYQLIEEHSINIRSELELVCKSVQGRSCTIRSKLEWIAKTPSNTDELQTPVPRIVCQLIPNSPVSKLSKPQLRAFH